MVCENCGKEHNGNYGSGKFCSQECARSYATKNDLHKLKEAKCIDCDKIIYIGKRASIKKCRCEECNNKHINPSDIKCCNICGRLYNKQDHCCKNEFCQKHNINQIKTLIKYFGFDKTKLGTLQVEDEFNRIRNILYDLYWNQEKSFSDIAQIFNYKSNPGNISKFFNYLEIESRSFSQCSILTYLQGKQNNKQQWHTTWNNKEVYLRSTYELDYAKELDEYQINYEVEYFHIKYWDSQKQEYRCAIPDFYIPKDNMIVEIKSSWTLDKQNMIDKKKAYVDLGYKFKLICDHKEMVV